MCYSETIIIYFRSAEMENTYCVYSIGNKKDLRDRDLAHIDSTNI